MIAILAAAAALPMPQVPPPPVISAGNGQQLIAWHPGEAQCGDAAVRFADRVTPFLAMGWINESAPVPPLTATFRIDATGRPLGIKLDGSGYRPFSTDVAPALAASRFSTNVPLDRCRIVYTASHRSLESATIGEMRAFAIAPNERPTAEVFRRTYPAGSDCFDPAPQPLLRAFPRFDTLPLSPGRIEWSMTGFDIDAAGKPVNIATVDGTHVAPLDAASRQAVADSRFAGGPRHGCVFPYYRSPSIVAAPEAPTKEAFSKTSATCPVHADWVKQPFLIFPPAYERRKIDGWAIIGYDVAPWGETGNVAVLASEPTADFGDTAAVIVRQARRAASATGYTGCVERVVFRMKRDGAARAGAPN